MTAPVFPVQVVILVVAVVGTGLAFTQLPFTFWAGHALFALACFAWGWIREHDFAFMPGVGYGNLFVGVVCYALLYLFCNDFGVAEKMRCLRPQGGLLVGRTALEFVRYVPHLAPFCLTIGIAILTGYLFRPRI